MVKVSIIILTKNVDNDFEKTLKQVYSQDVDFPYEVLVIDSESTDLTLTIAKKYPVRLFKIPAEDFHYSGTRNYGVSLSKGALIVFLGGDAIPLNREWLQNLVKPLEKKYVGGVYSRQIPKQNADPSEKFLRLNNYPKKNSVKTPDKIYHHYLNDYVLLSNVSSAFRRELLVELPFSTKVIMGEDKEWAKQVLSKGYSVVYSAYSIVYHSHRHNVKSLMARYLEEGISLTQVGELSEFSFKTHFSKGFRYINLEMNYHFRRNPFWVPIFFFYTGLKTSFMTLGQNHKFIPKFLKRRISFNWKLYENVHRNN